MQTQQCAVPMLLQDAPASFHGVVGRVKQELNGLADMVGEFNNAFEELSAPTGQDN